MLLRVTPQSSVTRLACVPIADLIFKPGTRTTPCIPQEGPNIYNIVK